MIYDTGNVVLCAATIQEARSALLQYGASDIDYPDDDQVTVLPQVAIVTTYAEASAALADYPEDTKWVNLGGCNQSLVTYMRARFGVSVNMPEAVRALNDEFAINPKLLNKAV